MLADTTCPICGEACKLLLPIAAGNYAFSCIIHHDFEVTRAGMEKGKQMRVVRWKPRRRCWKTATPTVGGPIGVAEARYTNAPRAAAFLGIQSATAKPRFRGRGSACTDLLDRPLVGDTTSTPQARKRSPASKKSPFRVANAPRRIGAEYRRDRRCSISHETLGRSLSGSALFHAPLHWTAAPASKGLQLILCTGLGIEIGLPTNQEATTCDTDHSN